MDSWLINGIGRVLREKRHAMRLSTRDAAAKAEISLSSLMRMERGVVDFDICVLSDLCSSMGMTVSELFNEVYFNDCERILVISADRASAISGELAKPHREVITAINATDAQVSLANWRTDLLVIDVEAGSSILVELGLPDTAVQQQIALVTVDSRLSLKAQEARKLSAVKLLPADTHLDAIKVHTDEVLSGTSKGRVCSLRRHRDDLAATRGKLSDQRRLLLEQRERLNAQIQVMNSRQHRLSSSDNMDSSEAKMQEDTIGIRKAELEVMASHLADREDKVAAQEKANNEVSRFLKRNESWLEEDQLDEMDV